MQQMCNRGSIMKKRRTKQQKVIDQTFELIQKLLTTAQKAIHEPTGDRYLIHHKLLEMIPIVTLVLNGNGFTQTDKITQTIRDVAEIVAPTPTGVYT